MTRQDLLNLLADDLRPIVEAQGGKWFLARDPAEPYAILAAMAMQGWACILSYTGDQPQGEQLEGAFAEAAVDLWIGRPLDLNADPGAWIKGSTSTDEKALLARYDFMQNKALTIVLQGEGGDRDHYARFLGSEAVLMPVTGVPLRAWKIRIAWDCRITITSSDYRYINAT